MGIKIYTTKADTMVGAAQAPTGIGSSAFVETTNGSASQLIGDAELLLIYVHYVKGYELGLDLNFGIVDARIPGFKFMHSSLDGDKVVIKPMRIIASGSYRIPLPVSPNEDFLTLDATLSGDGDASIWLIPALSIF